MTIYCKSTIHTRCTGTKILQIRKFKIICVLCNMYTNTKKKCLNANQHVCIGDANITLLLTPKFELASPLWKQVQLNWSLSTMCKIMSARDGLLFGNLTQGHKITALRNKTMPKAPPGECIYKEMFWLPALVNSVFNTQSFSSWATLNSCMQTSGKKVPAGFQANYLCFLQITLTPLSHNL